jgi:indole-3-glycerol phosphate synthase
VSEFLARVVAGTVDAVGARRALVPDAVLEEGLVPRAERPFHDALARPGMSLISELKRASPSRGPIQPDADAAEVVSAYERAGASACSILTEPEYFGGSLADLEAARAATRLPLLRKDFIVDRYQLLEARAAGADAALLIVAAMGVPELRHLIEEADRIGLDALVEVHHEIAIRLGLDVLIEVHDATELEAALALNPPIVGINNRNLKTLDVDIETAHRLRRGLPAEVVAVAESGITTRHDVERLEEAGVDAILVGETLMRAGDPAATVAKLLGR